MKSILLAFFVTTTSMYAAEITKDQASVMEAAVGSSIGTVAGDLLQPYTSQHTKPISTIAGAAAEIEGLRYTHIRSFEMKLEWEPIDSYHTRAKVFGGWLVKAYECQEHASYMTDQGY